MRLPFGLTIGRQKKDFSAISENRGWYRLLESFPGAWQTNFVVDRNTVLSYHAVYACITLISSDIAKLRVKLVEQNTDGIWSEFTNAAHSPVLKKPNPIQNRIQFWESWILSKLIRGNTYVLKVRDDRNVVVRMYVLDPQRVTPLVSDDGEVFYQLHADNVSGIEDTVYVPAREIIHDRFNCLYHPLVGTSPIFAAGVAATQGINIQSNSATFFGNRSQPGGVLTAPGAISDATVARLKADWETRFSGENAGKVAILGDGLHYERMAMSAEESQLIEQHKWSAEVVCSTFHVPPYKIGVGPLPSYNNVQSLNTEYYSQCLQVLIEAAELCLDEGLEMKGAMGTEFDLDGLLRMDSTTQMHYLKEAIGSGVMSPNEARKKVDLGKVPGGDSPYLQQQNYSLGALAKRDAKDDPFGKEATEPSAPPPVADNDDAEANSAAKDALIAIYKGFG